MTRFEFGDVVLVRFPFTDQSSSKRRPAAVVSTSSIHDHTRDIIIVAITSRTDHPRPLDRPIENWKEAGLLRPSLLKPVVATIESDLVARTLGRLREPDRTLLREMLRTILNTG